MTNTTNTTNTTNVVAALVCLEFPGIPFHAAKRGVEWLASQSWGAVGQGEGYTTFRVEDDWDGHCFVGYFRPSLAQVARDCGRTFWEEGPSLTGLIPANTGH